MKFVLSSKSVGDGVAMARIVKPETGDFCMRFDRECLVIFSYDKRRYVRVSVPYSNNEVPKDFRSEEFYVTPERTSLFDSDLESVTVKINAASVSIKAEGGDQSRQASLKRRAKKSKRTPVPDSVVPSGASSVLAVRRDLLEEVLGHLLCSTVIGKTEEEMRVNQIHFYSDSLCATSMTRFYGTVVRLRFPVPDFSIVGTDAPSVQTFASKASVEEVSLYQDERRLYASDGYSCLSLTRVSGKRPPLVLADNSLFGGSCRLKKDQIAKALIWAGVAVQDEGTSRVRLKTDGSDFVMVYKDEEISRIRCDDKRGDLDADFQVRYLKHIVDHISSDIRLFYGYPSDPNLLCLSPDQQSDSYDVHHYMKAMVEK
jgi:hypothetical protein